MAKFAFCDWEPNFYAQCRGFLQSDPKPYFPQLRGIIACQMKVRSVPQAPAVTDSCKYCRIYVYEPG